jgi:hypothetical protein
MKYHGKRRQFVNYRLPVDLIEDIITAAGIKDISRTRLVENGMKNYTRQIIQKHKK